MDEKGEPVYDMDTYKADVKKAQERQKQEAEAAKKKEE
ncbi:hypothetical protein Bsph_1925 [Lysinibacillus sphaericus C3-41]|uniref:Uncharacterized protein n=1 Tax=Lysinibacillus sphaericus (strain C3-41) TaxID=444177 RepID=B1HTA1_LYSSC|nr:hypothetical protein Bsph_1925 [Lysinibacillus sphaericus C3-41]